MITSLSEQPWGRRELDPPQRLRGLSGSLRGSCAQPGRDCVAWSLLPHPWAGDGPGGVGAFRAGGSSFVIPPWASLLLPCVPSTPPPSPQILQSSACAQIGLSGASGIGVARRTGTVRQSATDSSPLSRCMCAHTQARTRTVCECVETPPGRGGAHAKKTAQGLGAGGGMLLRDSACHPHLPGLEVSCSPPPDPPPRLGSAEQVSAPAWNIPRPGGAERSPGAGRRCPAGSGTSPARTALEGPGVLPGRLRRAGCPLPPGLAARLPAERNPPALSGTPAHGRAAASEFFLLAHKMQEFRALTRQRDNMKCRLRAPVALGNERPAGASQKAHS